MKRLFAAALAALSSIAFGATLVPIQLLNTAGSTANQVIASTGPTTAAAWTTLTAGGLGGLTAANNLSDLVSAATARTNLGLTSAATTAIGTSGATIPLLSTANTWTLGQTFTVRPTFNGATPWDSSNLASPAQTTGATFTGAITPSQTLGIVGTTTNNNANAGAVGEVITNSTTGTSLTTNVAANATSASLTAGDWDVECTAQFNPAGSTVISRLQVAVGTTSANVGVSLGAKSLYQLTFGTGLQQTIASPVTRIQLAATTTVYCPVESAFTTSTMTVDGLIRARRPR